MTPGGIDHEGSATGPSESETSAWFEQNFDPILKLDLEGGLEAINPACVALLGGRLSALGVRRLADLLVEHQQSALDQQWSRWLDGISGDWETELRTREGEPRSVRIRAWLERSGGSEPSRMLVLIRDLTKDLRAAARWRRSEERFDSLFHFAGDAILIHDLAGPILDANPRASEMLGSTVCELRQRQILDFAPASTRRLMRGAMEQLEKLGSYRFEADLVRSTGEGMAVAVSSSLLSLDGRQVVQSHLRDISRHRNAEHLLQRAYFNDPLTGLPNRTWLEDRLAVSIDRAQRRSDEGFILMLLGLDRFQTVNDGLGRRVGDQILVEVAARLSRTVGDGDAVARVGSDEFAVIMPRSTGLIRAREAADALQETVAEPLDLEDRKLVVTTSVGIVQCRDSYRRAEDCLRDAGSALMEAKADGVQGQKVFTKAMWNRALRRLDLEQALRRAVQEDQLRLYFQPIVDMRTGKIRELECLVRWQHPERGIVPPMEFLPLAEETGLIMALDQWVLGEAARANRRFRDRLAALAPDALAVNVSSGGFCRLELVGLVDEVLRENRLSGRYLKVEVTESAMIGEIALAAEVLGRLQERGVQVCLDDFGTGYASLGYLHRFPVSTLKIDRSFVSGPSRGSKIIEAVVLMGHNLGMKITAEGIETADDLARVRALGCEMGQGYLFSRPLDEASIIELLAQDPTW